MIKSAQRLVILSHIYAPGPPHALWDYLRKEGDLSLEFIGHPLETHRSGESFYQAAQANSEPTTTTIARKALPMPLAYLQDIWLNWFWLAKGPKRDLVIALDSLNAFSAIWLKRIGRVRSVVFYTIDYVPQRFNNKWLNRLYHWLDFFACQHADFVWNLSDLMAEARLDRGLKASLRAKQLVVPIGTEPVATQTIKHRADLVVFMGHLRAGQGVDRLIQAWPEISQKRPQARLRVIGGGPLLEEYRQMAKKLGLTDQIEFTGFVPTNAEMRELLAEGSIAVAPYVDDPNNYTRYTDPGKPKEYLATGLPVVITKVPAIAKTIQSQRLGLAIDDNLHAIAKAVTSLLADPELEGYRERAIAFAETQTWDLIFQSAFQQMKLKLGPPDA